MKIELREFKKRGANGDRDQSGGVEYSDYEVVLVSEGRENVLKEVEGYDYFHTAPYNRQSVRKEAESYAKKQAEFFGAEVERFVYTEKPPKPQKTEWVRQRA